MKKLSGCFQDLKSVTGFTFNKVDSKVYIKVLIFCVCDKCPQFMMSPTVVYRADMTNITFDKIPTHKVQFLSLSRAFSHITWSSSAKGGSIVI